MNSVTKHISAETLAATLLMMRSARKEVFFVVEGEKDVSFYSEVFGISESNVLSCKGKGIMTDLYNMADKSKALDEGVCFIRDRDFDSVTSHTHHRVCMLVSDMYDIEMHLLHSRLFRRVMKEYSRGKGMDSTIDDTFKKVSRVSAHIGALRKFSCEKDLALDFDGLPLRFVKVDTIDINVDELVRIVLARSRKSSPTLAKQALTYIESETSDSTKYNTLSCGKDFLSILSQVIARGKKYCDQKECSEDLLSRILRIGAHFDDVKGAGFVSHLGQHLKSCQYKWTGINLS